MIEQAGYWCKSDILGGFPDGTESSFVTVSSSFRIFSDRGVVHSFTPLTLVFIRSLKTRFTIHICH